MGIYDPDIAWDFIGDFNCIMGSHEKLGGRPPVQIACQEFVAFTSSANLIHMQTQGAQYTWSNERGGNRHTEVRLKQWN